MGVCVTSVYGVLVGLPNYESPLASPGQAHIQALWGDSRPKEAGSLRAGWEIALFLRPQGSC